MYEHLKNIQALYGDNIYVQIPNDIFKVLSDNIRSKNGKVNIQQLSFAYAYILIVSILYKYAHFVDVDNGTYVQNSDIKEILGYSKTTKSVDHIIKNGGVLDSIGLTSTVKDYPVDFYYSDEEIDGISIRTFTTLAEASESDVQYYNMIRGIVKNRNYEVKEPLFFFSYDDNNGTLYDYSNTHEVRLDEVINFISDETLDNVDMCVYFFLKSMCKGYKDDTSSIKLFTITSQIGIGKDAFYSHLDKIKKKGYVDVSHRGWVSDSRVKLEANSYKFNGIIK